MKTRKLILALAMLGIASEMFANESLTSVGVGIPIMRYIMERH